MDLMIDQSCVDGEQASENVVSGNKIYRSSELTLN